MPDSYTLQFVIPAGGQLKQEVVYVPSLGESVHLTFAELGIPAALFSWRLADEHYLLDEFAEGVSPERLATSGRVIALALMMMAHWTQAHQRATPLRIC